MKNSRQKGARGERLWRDELRANGYNARRGQQYSGGNDSPDVFCEEMSDHFWPEVKFVEKLNVRLAYAQAERDCDGEQIPYVAHKQSNKEWLVTMSADSFFALAEQYLTNKYLNTNK